MRRLYSAGDAFAGLREDGSSVVVPQDGAVWLANSIQHPNRAQTLNSKPYVKYSIRLQGPFKSSHESPMRHRESLLRKGRLRCDLGTTSPRRRGKFEMTRHPHKDSHKQVCLLYSSTHELEPSNDYPNKSTQTLEERKVQ